MPQVKTFSQAVSDTVTVHWPLQCQVEIPDLSSITRLCFVYLKKILKNTFFGQVIPERADHIMGSASTFQRVPWFLSQYDFDVEGIPPSVEMFFNPTGHEALIQPIGRDFGEVVYRDGHHFYLAEFLCLLTDIYKWNCSFMILMILMEMVLALNSSKMTHAQGPKCWCSVKSTLFSGGLQLRGKMWL